MKTLEEFKDEFLKSQLSEFKPIEVRNSGNRMSLIVLRDPPFQVEMVLWMPGVAIPAHRHPNIDALALFVSGELVLLLGENEEKTNDLVSRAKVWPAKALKGRAIRIRPNDWHGGKAGASGASFWSFQKWEESAIMTAAGMDWDGPKLITPELSKLCV